ncbi:MAG: molybdopterin-dependent oxidoreductase [Gammaproteobacteria bacterium]|nr:molybdopterin-dependent oxidoreductase [Gammaproteobacteria bacterium]
MSGNLKTTTTLTHWGAYELEVTDNEVTKVSGIDEDNDTSPIGQSLSGTLNDSCRITAPVVRKSYLEQGFRTGGAGRGAEPFVEVSWETAEKLVAAEIQRVSETHGNQAIFGGSYGWASAGRFHHAQSQLHRFLSCAGGYTYSVDTYSFAAAEVILPHVIGNAWNYVYSQTSWPNIISHTQILLSFGGMPLKNAQISNGGTAKHVQRNYMRAAKEAGVEFINVSPLRDDCADFLISEWHSPRPNTDVAIMLGMAHSLLINDRHDKHFLQHHCVGFEQFADYLMGDTDGQPKDAEWAANISGMDASLINDLALRISSKRTMISLSWSLSRQDHGEQPYWMGVTLAAMLGQIGLPGGGIGFGYAAENSVGNHCGPYKLGALGRKANKVKEFIPVARIADMLLHPGDAFHYNGSELEYPDIKLVYWAGGNPFHQHQDTGKLLQAWQRPQSIVVNEIWWNAAARHADIVLPATSALERNDLGGKSVDPGLFAMHQAVLPFAQARNDYDIFRGISSHLGFENEFSEGREEMDWIHELYESTRENNPDANMPVFEEFWTNKRYLSLPVSNQPRVVLSDFRHDPETNKLSTPSGKIEIYSEVINKFEYTDCPPHPVWLEPVEWLGSSLSARYPLHLISNQPASRLHSQLDNGLCSRQSKIKEREPLRIHPDDAKDRGIEDEDVVRLYNDRGQCLAGVIIDATVSPSSVQMSTGAWWDPVQSECSDSLCVHGQVNVLTIDKGTSCLAQGPSALSCLIEIEKYEKKLPDVSIFQAPTIHKP